MMKYLSTGVVDVEPAAETRLKVQVDDIRAVMMYLHPRLSYIPTIIDRAK